MFSYMLRVPLFLQRPFKHIMNVTECRDNIEVPKLEKHERGETKPTTKGEKIVSKRLFKTCCLLKIFNVCKSLMELVE